MRIANIKQLLSNGRGEKIIISLINTAKTPYKIFTIDEIDTLTGMGISENIIASMIDVTEKLNQAEESNGYQQATQVYERPETNPTADAVKDRLMQEGVKAIFDSFF